MNLAAASCHLLNRPPLNRPPHVDIRKKSYPSNPRLRGNVTYHICISFWGPKLELGRLATTTARPPPSAARAAPRHSRRAMDFILAMYYNVGGRAMCSFFAAEIIRQEGVTSRARLKLPEIGSGACLRSVLPRLSES